MLSPPLTGGKSAQAAKRARVEFDAKAYAAAMELVKAGRQKTRFDCALTHTHTRLYCTRPHVTWQLAVACTTAQLAHCSPLTACAPLGSPSRACLAGDADGIRSVAPSVLRSYLGVPHSYLLIHAAAEGGHDKCIAALAECGAGATIGAVTDDGRTAASFAAENGHASCLAELVVQGAAYMFTTADTEQRTTLQWKASHPALRCWPRGVLRRH
jgi:hypothetical protein